LVLAKTRKKSCGSDAEGKERGGGKGGGKGSRRTIDDSEKL
jgi:hypothetical protein